MEKKLFVGSLSFKTTEDSLRDFFSQAGSVETVSIIMDRNTGRSRGFGFVEMASEDDAAKAKDMLNGKELDGRTIMVDEAKPMEKKPFRKSFDSRDSRDRY